MYVCIVKMYSNGQWPEVMKKRNENIKLLLEIFSQ